MKKLLFLLILAFLCIACHAEGWDTDSPHYIFDSEKAVNQWNYSGCNGTFEFGNLKIVTNMWDPTVSRALIGDEQFEADEFPWFAYRYKADAGTPGGGLFFTSSTLPALTDASYSPFMVDYKDNWTNHVMDMNSFAHGNWGGTINLVRLDAINASMQYPDIGARIYINRMGFFRTQEQAEAFLAEGGEEDYNTFSTMTGDLFKTLVPAGVLSAGYDENDYILSSSTPEGEGESPVVQYTDSDGNTDIVALSYTNQYGYTRYVAGKAGTYSLVYNHKNYEDTASHWAKEHIDFVSDRNVMLGTDEGEFSPDMPMTRAMFVTALGRMHGVDTSKYTGNGGYGDVNPSEYYAPYAVWAKDNAIISGTTDALFAPETAVTRAQMALAIENYIDYTGFKTQAYVLEEAEFDDISGCSADEIKAIKDMADIGILVGTDNSVFDPDGICTRAEVSAVIERTAKVLLGANNPASAYTNEYITRDRLRIGVWGFANSLATPKGMKELYELGADLIVSGNGTSGQSGRETILNYADMYGIEVFVTGYFPYGQAPTDEQTNTFIENVDPRVVSAGYADHPSVGGHYINDEPGTDFFENVGKICDNYETKMPGKRAFVNLLPMYANAAQLKYGASAASIEYYDPDPDLYRKYCQAWADTNNCDYICTDIYPLNWTASGQKTTYANYVESINQIATVARENNLEFWCCIQTYGWTGSKRTPNEAEYRWQCYSMLSFGCTGILLWSYMGSASFPSLIHPATLEPTQAYYDCKPVVQEMRLLSDTFIKYKNLGAFTVNCTDATPYLKMSGEYTEFDTIKSIQTDAPLLIGCFENKDGKGGTAFTVVNMTELAQENAYADVILTVSDPSKTVTVYERGEPYELELESDGSFEMTLGCGDGYFFTVE